MAKPLTRAQVAAAFIKWGVPHYFTPGCDTRKNSGSWIDITGCMFHHTASDASDAANLSLLIRGRTGLPGPLSNFGVGDDGVVDVVALGPANHAGGGDLDVLTAVQKESYGAYPPKTDKTHGEAGAVSGNPRFYGWEVYYGFGSDKTIDAIQYRATILSMVAIIDALDALDGPSTKWTSKSILGHKEWQEGKPDPAGVDMAVARADAQWCLDNGPASAVAWYISGTKKKVTPMAAGDLNLKQPIPVRDPATNKVVQIPLSTLFARTDWCYQELLRQRETNERLEGKLDKALQALGGAR